MKTSAIALFLLALVNGNISPCPEAAQYAGDKPCLEDGLYPI